MPRYTFEALDPPAQTRDESYSMAERPAIGAIIELDGRLWRRVLSPSVTAAPISDTHFVCHQFPTHDPDFPRVNAYGEGCFASKAEVLAYMDKKRGQGKEVYYDRPGFH